MNIPRMAATVAGTVALTVVSIAGVTAGPAAANSRNCQTTVLNEQVYLRCSPPTLAHVHYRDGSVRDLCVSEQLTPVGPRDEIVAIRFSRACFPAVSE